MSLEVLLVDSHRLTLEGVRRALEASDEIEVVGQALTAAELLATLKRKEPDVVLLDSQLPDMDGIACLGLIRQNYPRVKVIMLSGERDSGRIDVALRAGATAFILKTVDPRDLAAGIRQAVAGTVFTLAAPEPEAAHGAAESGLTDRERNVLEAIARGLSNKAIGKEFWVTEQTVKFHLNNIYRKLGVPNRTAAARYAYQHGLVDGTAVSLQPHAA